MTVGMGGRRGAESLDGDNAKNAQRALARVYGRAV